MNIQGRPQQSNLNVNADPHGKTGYADQTSTCAVGRKQTDSARAIDSDAMWQTC